MNLPVCTRDRFLGGRVVADQPKNGFRAGHDTVLLAAAVPAVAGQRVLELGAGVGIASLCLAVRVPGIEVTGFEIQPPLVQIANANAALNGMLDRAVFEEADIVDRFPVRGDTLYDHVFTNPPFHPDTGQASPSAAKDAAKRGQGLAFWIWRGLEWLKEGGTLTAIVRADLVDSAEEDAQAGAEAFGTSAMTVFPLFPHVGEAPKRALIRFVKGPSAPRRTLPGLVLHEAGGRNTDAAEAFLRHGSPIGFA